MSDLNGEYLRDVFLKDEFQREILEISTYCANIKQERPIMYLLAKYLWKMEFAVALEYPIKDNEGKTIGKTDLLVNSKRIEAKFNYESDLAEQNYDEDVKDMKKTTGSSGNNILVPIAKDMLCRKPDFFILIIQSRDLRNVREDEMDRVCLHKKELKYNHKNGCNNEVYLGKLKQFLIQINKQNPFKQETLEIHADSFFPSTYHIFICEFNSSLAGKGVSPCKGLSENSM